MKFKLVSFIFFSLFLTTYFLLPTPWAIAVTTSDLSQQIDSIRRERQALVEEQKRLQEELDKVSRESATLGSAVKSLDSARKKLGADIRVTQSKIAATDLNIKVLENNVNAAQRKINTHKGAVETAIKALYESDSRPLISMLLASVNFGDAWHDNSQLTELSTRLDDEVEELRETKEVLNKEKDSKEKVKQQIVALNQELSGQKAVVEESKKAKEKLLAESKNKEALYQEMLRENLRRQEESEQDLYKLESELKFILDPSSIPKARGGILSWPLDNVYVTQKFGRTAGAARLYSSGSHNGIDFRATQGTTVRAMLEGVVEGMGNTDEQKGCYSYGRWILIKHPNGLSSIYAHLSGTIVKLGQKVSTGDVIGYSGGLPRVFGSGYSTGQHLHIGLFASAGVSVKQFVTSKNCKQIHVPVAGLDAYLDPLAYLPKL